MVTRNYEVRFFHEDFEGEHGILAVFPESITDRDASEGRVNCYASVGQNGEADIDYVAGLRLATQEEGWQLFSELRAILKATNVYAEAHGDPRINLVPTWAEK